MSRHPLNSIRPADDRDVAVYIAEMIAELRALAQQRPRLRTLAYLLDMARLEAGRAIEDSRR